MTTDIMIDRKIIDSVAPEPIKPKHKSATPKSNAFDWLLDQNYHVRGEMALWVAVITQAMMDALSRSDNSEARYNKHEAINWLTGNSRNFITVCHYAGLDPDYVRKKAKRALVAPQPWRAEAGKGKRYLERKAYRKSHKNIKNEAADNNRAELRVENVIVGHWGI